MVQWYHNQYLARSWIVAAGGLELTAAIFRPFRPLNYLTFGVY
jgi:hypothetical protein